MRPLTDNVSQVRRRAARSDASGYFKLVLHKRVLSDLPITVTFRQNSGIEQSTSNSPAKNCLYITES